ncbi:hypothetical protein GOP47_0014553 [Adiantum capillus-veneris]|uniref:Survival protein SurE-like phosphatase/nucleotidase domain-containing protein n=1 Tax=Adiantum capillus-veneris TaxID=13818 RepID=A0A9D4ZEA2_ADICA|nr:hypothetical protein GOP47_0014553 [Adiantum capillus-veneris]
MASSAEGGFAPPPSLVSNLKEALKGRLAREDVEALVRSLRSGGFCNVYVCAPQSEDTEISTSTAKQKTLEVCHVDFEGATAFEVSGLPIDCVSLGLSGVLFSKKPSLVICGISRGSNCGFHIFSSLSIAGARQALVSGVPSLVLSLDWKDMESHEDEFAAAADFCLPLIHAAVSDSQTGHFLNGFFLNINLPTPFSKHKGFKITKQGTSRPRLNWRAVPSHKSLFGMGSCKQNAIGVRVAELGLAASAVAAARRANSSLKNVEVESVAGPTNGSHVPATRKKQHFRMEVAEMVREEDDSYDFGALQDGFVSVTPLGSRNDSDVDLLRRVADWVAGS